MSLFIAGLTLDDELLRSGKIGAVVGSALSATVGCAAVVVLEEIIPPRK